jgi:hypothetical protein
LEKFGFGDFANGLLRLTHERALKSAEKESRNYMAAQKKLELLTTEGADARSIERQTKKLKKLVCGRYVGGPANGTVISNMILKNNSEYCMSLPHGSSEGSRAFISIYKHNDGSVDYTYVSTIIFPFELEGWQKDHPGAFSNRTPDGKKTNMWVGAYFVSSAILATLFKMLKNDGEGR